MKKSIFVVLLLAAFVFVSVSCEDSVILGATHSSNVLYHDQEDVEEFLQSATGHFNSVEALSVSVTSHHDLSRPTQSFTITEAVTAPVATMSARGDPSIEIVPRSSAEHAAIRRVQNVLSEINLARTEPHKYAQIIAAHKAHFKGNTYSRPSSKRTVETEEGVAALDDAIKFLLAQKPLKPLLLNKGLTISAQMLADMQHSSNSVGHVGPDSSTFIDRISRFGKWQGDVGENIVYGQSKARDIVMNMIVDDGYAQRGHRHNIFTDSYRFAGIGFAKHTSRASVCVVTFAQSYVSNK